MARRPFDVAFVRNQVRAMVKHFNHDHPEHAIPAGLLRSFEKRLARQLVRQARLRGLPEPQHQTLDFDAAEPRKKAYRNGRCQGCGPEHELGTNLLCDDCVEYLRSRPGVNWSATGSAK